MNRWYGYNAPFIGGPEGVMSKQADDRLVKNDLLQLLMTSPGERVMRPDFGSGIRNFLFQNIDDSDLDSLKLNIQNAIQTYEPRVSVSEISIEKQSDDNKIHIKVYGTFKTDVVNTASFANQALLLVELGLPLNTPR